MTDEEVVAWLRTSKAARRVVLVEIDYMYQVGIGDEAVPTLGTLYFSTKPYIDESVPRPYIDCVKRPPRYTRSLDRETLRGSFRSSISTLELDNTDNGLDQTNTGIDYMLALPIDGSEVRVYVGELTWARADFVHLFSALAVKASAPAPADIIEIELKDTSLLLNKSIGGTTAVGGTGPSKDRYRPYNFGYVHQTEPILLDPITFTYVHSDTGVNTAAVKVRSNGVELVEGTDWDDNGDGTFTLANNPQGEQITCDVLATLGSGGTDYRMSDMVYDVVGVRAGLDALGRYSGPTALITSPAEIANDFHSGLNVKEKRSLPQVLDDMMSTVNSAWAIDRMLNFYYFRMRPEALSTLIADSGGTITVSKELNQDDVTSGSLSIDHEAPKYIGYQSYANINWTQQTQFSISLEPDGKEQLTRKGSYSAGFFGEEVGTTQYLGATLPFRGGAPELYHLSMSDYELESTLISGETDDAQPDPAVAVTITGYQENYSALRRSQNLPWKEFLNGSFGLDCYTLELGDIVNLTHPLFRKGFEGGVLLQVYSTAIDPLLGVDLGLVRRRFAGISGPLSGIELREDSAIELREDSSRELRE